MWKKLSARAAAPTGLLLIVAGLVGASLAPSGNVALASASESAGLYGACGNVDITTPGCGVGTCSVYCQMFTIICKGNIKQNPQTCSSLSDACGSYHQQVSCR